MPTCHVFHHGTVETVDGLHAGLSAMRADEGFLWVELDRPDAGAFDDLTAALGLHPLAVEDAVHARDRPKLDLYDEHQFFSLTTLRQQAPMAPLDVGRVMVFLGEGFAVTVRQEGGTTLARARRRLEREAASRPLPLDALHAVVDTVVDDLTEVAGTIEASILSSADRLFGAERSDEARALYQITRQLLAMAHAVQPLVEPLRHLSSGSGADEAAEHARRFQDVLDHALLLDRELSDYTELVDHLRGSNDSRIGLQQNTDMRKIAAWAAVVAVPTAITGFYGMNVPYPGFGEAAGAVTAVVLQLTLAAGLFLLFRRRRWL